MIDWLEWEAEGEEGTQSNTYALVGRNVDNFLTLALNTMRTIVEFMRGMRGTCVHVSQAGVIMASDDAINCAGVTRHSAGTPPSQSNS